ncbi:major facilitator superfamily transporter [Nemania sp. NC0429]|nr:major facilitator superfamily transporter [Nemania sp. NC0429]
MMAAVQKAIATAEEQPLLPTPTTPTSTESEPFSAFTPRQKRWILFLTGFAGAFSPLSSFIFFPVIVPIARSLGVTVGLLNLAITSYMVVSGVVPAILGSAADKFGRRPAYIVALCVYFAANVGLAVQNSYPALLVLRMVQSAGVSGTISLGYGVVSDIATPSERGSYVGIVAIGPNVSPPLGPVIGGLLASALGWRWIFWFLVILGGICLLMILLALPETARAIVGNGSIPATGVNQTLLSVLTPTRLGGEDRPARDAKTGSRLASLPNPLASLKLLLEKDLFILLLCNGIFYATGACVQASLSTQFIKVYGYKELQAGLIYIPFGLGGLANVYLWGKVLDFEYAQVARAHGFDLDEVKTKLVDDFPIELARLRSMVYLIFPTVAAMAGYGWAVHKAAHPAIPLVLQGILGLTLSAGFVSFGTLNTDLNPGRSSTAAASGNIVRCSLAAAGTAVLQPIIDAVGAGWCFTIFGLLLAACGPMLLFQIRVGPKWRMLRRSKEAAESDNASD